MLKKFTILLCSIMFLTLTFSVSCEAFFFDDFEYWDSPLDHGWISSDYQYPVMGYGVGYGTCYTQIDRSEGSRVMIVNCQPSVFNNLQPYAIANYHLQDPNTGLAPKQPVLSYKVKAPLPIESFTQVRCYLLIKTEENQWLWLCYLPVEGDKPQDLGDFVPIIPPPSNLISTSLPCIGCPVGRGAQDSTWHCIVVDIQKNLDQALHAGLLATPQHLAGVYGLMFSGNQYSLDEIMFLKDDSRYKNHHPFVWDPGPQFATLFKPFELMLYASDPQNDKLSFDVQIGGWGEHGMQTKNFLYPLPYDPNDPYAPYTSARAVLRFTPQVLENLIVTVKVSDQYTSDITMFPLSVVNYPVTNNPPVIQRKGTAANWFGYVGETWTYQMKVFDKENDRLSYSASIVGLPSYQYGPWQESIINPQTGLLKITPKFEGVFNIRVIVQDEKGATGVSDRKLYVATRGGGWLNHPPVRMWSIKSPQFPRAGSLYTIVTKFIDPDGDKLYYTTNIGSMTPDGSYSFLTYFPGQYPVTITAYDIHGGYATLNFLLDVQPWWSF